MSWLELANAEKVSPAKDVISVMQDISASRTANPADVTKKVLKIIFVTRRADARASPSSVVRNVLLVPLVSTNSLNVSLVDVIPSGRGDRLAMTAFADVVTTSMV